MGGKKHRMKERNVKIILVGSIIITILALCHLVFTVVTEDEMIKPGDIGIQTFHPNPNLFSNESYEPLIMNISFSNVSQPVLTIGMGNFTPSYIEVSCEWYLEQDYHDMNLTLTYNESEMKIDLFELCLELKMKSKMEEMTFEIIGDGKVGITYDMPPPKNRLEFTLDEDFECGKAEWWETGVPMDEYDEYIKCVEENSEPLEIKWMK